MSWLKYTFPLVAALEISAALLAQESSRLTPDEILKRVTYPPEFKATVFASPPDISYPVFISAAPDGTLFVGCDENGSLDQRSGRGRVVRCQDTNGDGKADRFTTFAKMDSPRGVAWDQSTRTLYVMHPPFLTAYHDDDNTGVANRQEDLISGLGFSLDFRGADHTINGIRLGIDGWIYVACGDYGAVKATGQDGRAFELRGGGILRIRPDGSGLEMVVRGTRNLLAVAISPTLELFTRDNTNDGDDWNDRLSFNPFGAQMGYPTLFRNFADEIIPTLFDFGGGSPVGSIFIDELNLPKQWAYGFYSVEWGRSEIDLHPLTQNGATWKADTKQFMTLTRATDLEVDGEGHLYAASWDGATFTYNGPNVGYILRLTPKETKAVAVPDFKKMSESQLVEHIASPSAVWRLAAQRELLVRGTKPGVASGLQKIITNHTNLGARVAAIFTLKQLQGVRSHPALMGFLKNDDLREYILKALGDDQRVAAEVPARPLTDALADKNPRVRLQAVTALGHLGKIEAAPALLRRTADSDYTVAHLAVQALRWLKASEVCLRALDSPEAAYHRGALRVLQALYEPAVVDGLLNRLAKSKGQLQQAIYATLARLALQEAPYTDPKMWWGTRPDTSGPIYKPVRWAASEKIEAALKQQLDAAQGEDAKAFVTALMRNKISFPGFSELLLSKAGKDTTSRLAVIAPLLSPKAPVPEDLLKALTAIATSTTEPPELRARALRLLNSVAEKNFPVVCDAFVPLAAQEQQGALAGVWEEFTRDSRHTQHVSHFAHLARDTDPARRTLGTTVLVNILTSPVITETKPKDSAQIEIARLWSNPDQAVSLINVIGRARAAQLEPLVRAQLTNPNPAVAGAARLALTSLDGGKSGGPGEKRIEVMKYEDVLKMVLATPGEPKIGAQLFLKQGCVVCHTISPNEPPKGPMLGGIATRYQRAELCESVLKPSVKIAQGFESQYFRMKNGDEVEGFVVKEGGDSVEVRGISGPSTILEKSDILERQKREKSIMPEGLVSNITPTELAALLAFLESISAK